jgi:hypothetical protein
VLVVLLAVTRMLLVLLNVLPLPSNKIPFVFGIVMLTVIDEHADSIRTMSPLDDAVMAESIEASEHDGVRSVPV